MQEVVGRAEVAEGVQELLHVALQEGVAGAEVGGEAAAWPCGSPTLPAASPGPRRPLLPLDPTSASGKRGDLAALSFH